LRWDYRKIPLILAHNELPVCAVSCLEEPGWLALGGSEAGKDPTRPDNSLSCIFLSSAAAFAGSAACRSWGAGSNFSAMANPPFMREVSRCRSLATHASFIFGLVLPIKRHHGFVAARHRVSALVSIGVAAT
jgi:hypothetical protein